MIRSCCAAISPGCTTKLGFSTGVLILPQRQTALVAKQAACLDVLCGGRFRLGIGVGWNEVEFIGLNENFHNRGRRSEEQVQVMQALWAEPHVTFKGKYHTIDDAGINPRPASGRCRSGMADITSTRCRASPNGATAGCRTPIRRTRPRWRYSTKLRTPDREAGRDPASVGIEVWTSCGAGTPADWRKEAQFWKQAGASHLCLTTTFNRRTHHRIAGTHAGRPSRWRCSAIATPSARCCRKNEHMQLGASMPVADIGLGPIAIRDYAQAVEGLGFDYLQAPDHVLGANPGNDTGEARIGTSKSPYHDPFVLFGFLAGCTQQHWVRARRADPGAAPGRAGGETGRLPRRAVRRPVAAGHRRRLEQGRVHRPEREFPQPRAPLGRASPGDAGAVGAAARDVQGPVSHDRRRRHQSASGIRPVPVWFGGHAEATFRRTAKYGDGWMPLAYPADETALAAFDKLRALIQAEGRDPADVGIEVWVSLGSGDEADWRREIAFWKQAGVTHVTAHTTFPGGHHKRIAGNTPADHLAAITRFRAAWRICSDGFVAEHPTSVYL